MAKFRTKQAGLLEVCIGAASPAQVPEKELARDVPKIKAKITIRKDYLHRISAADSELMIAVIGHGKYVVFWDVVADSVLGAAVAPVEETG